MHENKMKKKILKNLQKGRFFGQKGRFFGQKGHFLCNRDQLEVSIGYFMNYIVTKTSYTRPIVL